MRHFRDGDELHLEPWRASAFPVLRDLMWRTAGSLPPAAGRSPCPPDRSDGNADSIRKQEADLCYGRRQSYRFRGACVAACPNASGIAVHAAKMFHLGKLPQGQPSVWSAPSTW